jgi:hypothetical protein
MPACPCVSTRVSQGTVRTKYDVLQKKLFLKVALMSCGLETFSFACVKPVVS